MVLIFFGGLVFGSMVTFFIIGKITQRQFALQYSANVFEQAVLARELRSNKQEVIAKRIETNLPVYVLTIHQNKELRDAPNAQEALWEVKKVL